MKVLITVKTYPLPSESYQELVCTAGVREDGSFVRLYPIDYRYRVYSEWFKKYQWIEVQAEKNPKDIRPESLRPILNTTIKPLGEPLPTENKWAERKQLVLAGGIKSMCELDKTPQDRKSLGIVRPKSVTDFVSEPAELQWKPEWAALFKQQRIFGPQQKPLEKIPYKFSYKFICEGINCSGHQKMIEDWEVFELYRQMKEKFKDEQVALQKVRQKFFEQMCAPEIDTHFFVGTTLKFGTWIILGVFWPKK